MTFSSFILLLFILPPLPLIQVTVPVHPTPAAAQGKQATADPGQPARRVGGAVSPPMVVKMATPEFSKEAKAANIEGQVLVSCRVEADGRVSKVKVIRGIGYGLDEKAVEAVRAYLFRPAMEHGVPVPVEINVEVNFQIR